MRSQATLPSVLCPIPGFALAASLFLASAAAAAELHVGVGQTYSSIQAAIDASVAGDVVVVHPGGYPERINLLGRAITLRSLEGANRTVISSNSSVGAVVSCTTGETASCVIEGFTITGGIGPGILITSASPTVRDCLLVGNYSNSNNGGGTLYNGNGGSPRFISCTFSGNRAIGREGGAICAEATNGLITCENCRFVSNESTDGAGGAIRNTGTRLVLTGCEFRSNVLTANNADRRGGAIYSNAPVTATNCQFFENSVQVIGSGGRTARGGAIASHAQLDLVGCTFTGNRAEVFDNCCGGTEAWGGALWCETSAQTTITSCTFTQNKAQIFDPNDGRNARGGAAAFVAGCDPVIRNCTFTANSAVSANNGYGSGGTLWYEGGSAGLMEDCTIASSSAATEGGALFCNGGATPLVVRTRFANCSATNGNGGAIRVQDGGNAYLLECRVTGCSASTGGGLYSRNSQPIIDGCVFDRNTGATGSAIRTEGNAISGVPSIRGTFFCGNGGKSVNWIIGTYNDPNAGSNTLVAECSTDCNDNGIIDSAEIDSGAQADCNLNGIPDSCDVASAVDPDCNGNGVPDSCDIGTGVADCNANGIPDSCDISSGATLDCNGNGRPDGCDIASGTSADCDANGVPDSCQPDCDADGTINSCEILAGAPDCNRNGTPDSCDIASGLAADRNLDGTPDSCQALEYLGLRSEYVPIAGTANDPTIPATAVCVRIYAEFANAGADLLGVYGNQAHPLTLAVSGGGFFQATGGGNLTTEVLCTPEVPTPSFRYDSWLTIGRTCIESNSLQSLGFNFAPFVTGNGFTDNDCIAFVTPGSPQAFAGPTKRVLVAQLTSRTGVFPTFRANLVGRNADGTDWEAFSQLAPQPTLVDCNGNGTHDVLDVALGNASDCNDNGLPDSCEFPNFGADCNMNGVSDVCDIFGGTSQDIDNTGIPDECECVGDVNLDGRVDVDDIVDVILAWGDGAGSPADLNGDGIVGGGDLAIVIGNYGECK